MTAFRKESGLSRPPRRLLEAISSSTPDEAKGADGATLDRPAMARITYDKFSPFDPAMPGFVGPQYRG